MHPSWVGRQVWFQDSEENLFKWAWIISSECWGSCVRKLWDTSKQRSYCANRSIFPGTWQKGLFPTHSLGMYFPGYRVVLLAPSSRKQMNLATTSPNWNRFFFIWMESQKTKNTVYHICKTKQVSSVRDHQKNERKKHKSQWSQWNYLSLSTVGLLKNLPVNIHDLNF